MLDSKRQDYYLRSLSKENEFKFNINQLDTWIIFSLFAERSPISYFIINQLRNEEPCIRTAQVLTTIITVSTRADQATRVSKGMATLRLTIVETSTLADTPQLLELVEWEEEEVMDLVVEEDTPDKVE